MDSAEATLISVEVVYATADKQVLIALDVPPTTTLKQAVELSGILTQFPEIQLGGLNRTGIFSKPVALDTVLRAGDRVEIYRPLIADPKTARKQRAAESKEKSV
jgi:uncharacterized protein